MDWKDALSAARKNFDEAPETTEDIHTADDNNSSVQKGRLTVVSDKKGRKGKIATIVEGFTIPQNEVEEIARKLKQKLGVGGSVREGEILIQGDYKEKVKDYLISLKFNVK